MKKLFCIILCFFFVTISNAQKKKVVIGSSLGDVDSSLKEIFMDAMESALNDSGEFEIISNRDDYKDKLLGELEVQESGLINDDDWISIGKAEGADMVVFPKINSFDEQYVITVKLIDLRSGLSQKTIKPIYCPRSKVVPEGVEKLVSAISTGGMKHEKAKDIIECSTLPNTSIDKYNRSRKEWDEAVSECEKLGAGWRLPTRSELVQIITYVRVGNSLGGQWEQTTYWTSNERNMSSAFSVEFPSAEVTYESKTARSAFRCVRSE